MTIDVLGAAYDITVKSAQEDAYLKNADGYCDKTTRKIVVKVKDDDCELGDFERYQKRVMRHEIIHAFLFESGLDENWAHQPGHDETYVSWIAGQFPKLQTAFEQAGAL